MVSLIEEEYENFTKEGLWKRIFDRIQNEAAVLYTSSCKQARSAENRDRNRYRDVSPYDDFRVKLEGCENNYINASRVEVPLAGRTYILTQGPLANTSGHFWLMIWQQNSRGVLMLNRVVEDGRLKCHPYFPLGAEYGGDDSLTFPDVGLRVEYIKTEDHSYFVIRSLRIVNLQTEESKVILQFHYIDWPDFGIPKNSQTFLAFLDAVRQSGVIPSSFSPSDDSKLGPPVIHCSAGIGRSGTFCLVDSALVQVERTRSLLSLDIRSMLIDMRKYRCGLIQRPEQLQFSYMAILDGAHHILSSPPPSPPASNGLSDSNPTDDDQESSLSPDEDMSDGENEELEQTSSNKNATTNASNDGPAPPVRTSSLATDEVFTSNSQANSELGAPPPKPPHSSPETINSSNQSSTITDIPEPPRRTTSLHKSASLDEQPPPVPPRPPSTFDRQVSAPVPRSASETSQKSENFQEEDEYGYDNSSSSPMKRKREEMREERKRKTKEKVEEMRAKQQAAEAARNAPFYHTHWRFLVGAGVTLALAVGVVYLRPSILL